MLKPTARLPIIMLALALTVTMSGCWQRAAHPSLIPQEVKEAVQQRVDQKENAGVVVGVITPAGREYFSYGWMSEGSNRPVDEATLFEIGSISKVFTTLLLADMVERGEMGLDDPIQDYLPTGVTVPTFQGKPITLEHLATHTSGLPSIPDNINRAEFNNPYRDYSASQMYEFLSGYRLSNEPGTNFLYSNLGMGLLGHILELYSQSSYETLLKERISAELGMADTAIKLTAEQQDHLATGHHYGKPVGNWDFDVFAGAGAIRSTARDLLTFLGANMGMPATRLLPAMELTHSARADADLPEAQIGLGWYIREQDGKQITWHEGGTGGYYSFIGFIKDEQKGVVVLTNSLRTLDEIGFQLLLFDRDR